MNPAKYSLSFFVVSRADKMAETQIQLPSSPPPSVCLLDTRLHTPLPRGSATKSATSQSKFFTKLPPELRTEIYQRAFGHRMFHMDLRFTGPNCRSTVRRYHAGIDFMANMKHRPDISDPPKNGAGGGVSAIETRLGNFGSTPARKEKAYAAWPQRSRNLLRRGNRVAPKLSSSVSRGIGLVYRYPSRSNLTSELDI
jgi:hypothetical protein